MIFVNWFSNTTTGVLRQQVWAQATHGEEVSGAAGIIGTSIKEGAQKDPSTVSDTAKIIGPSIPLAKK
ncbi:MAG TPA: hypothetical protein VFS97_06735 [Nitrososphaeraceae archaeon]|nr:hypothetical protein [Nitrososphaeraceae archaeon]